MSDGKEDKPIKVTLDRGGKKVEYDIEKFRNPHRVIPQRIPNQQTTKDVQGKESNNGNAGGLLQNDGHRPGN